MLVHRKKETTVSLSLNSHMHKHKHVHMHMEGYHAFLLFPLRYHTEIRLTGIKYYIHQNKR